MLGLRLETACEINMKLEVTTTWKTGADVLSALILGGKDAVEIIGGNQRFTLRAVRNKYKHGIALRLRDDVKNAVYNIAGYRDARQGSVNDFAVAAEEYIRKWILAPAPVPSAHPADAGKQLCHLKFWAGRLLRELPEKRDWLDPEIEKELRAATGIPKP